MTRDHRRQVWVVGSREAAEFQPLLDWLSETTATRFATGRETALSDLPTASQFEDALWVVFLSARPDSLSRETVERWQRWFPLARFVVVLGSWCEGETRTGRPWPGVARVYWHQVLPRLMAPIANEDDTSAEWRLARTTTEAERLEATVTKLLHVEPTIPPLPALPDGQSIGIWSLTTSGWESIADACRLCGATPRRWHCVTSEPPDDVRALVIDLPDSCDFVEPHWQAATWRRRGIPALALVGFPRWEDCLGLEQLGVSLLSKPWRLVDFQRQLSALLKSTASIRGVAG